METSAEKVAAQGKGDAKFDHNRDNCLGVLAVLVLGSVLEVADYWLGEKISDMIKAWWNE